MGVSIQAFGAICLTSIPHHIRNTGTSHQCPILLPLAKLQSATGYSGNRLILQ